MDIHNKWTYIISEEVGGNNEDSSRTSKFTSIKK